MSGDKECVKDSDRDKMSEDMMISLLTIWMMRVTLLDEVSSKMATMLLMNFFFSNELCISLDRAWTKEIV